MLRVLIIVRGHVQGLDWMRNKKVTDNTANYGGGHNCRVICMENTMDYVCGHNHCDATYAGVGCIKKF